MSLLVSLMRVILHCVLCNCQVEVWQCLIFAGSHWTVMISFRAWWNVRRNMYFLFIIWMNKLIHCCSALTVPTSWDTISLTNFSLIAYCSFLSWILNATVLLLRATVCIYCGKHACCFLIKAHSCWNPKFQLWIATFLLWHYQESPEDCRKAPWASQRLSLILMYCVVSFYFPVISVCSILLLSSCYWKKYLQGFETENEFSCPISLLWWVWLKMPNLARVQIQTAVKPGQWLEVCFLCSPK